MKQYEAVIATLERIGGIATLARLNQEVFKIEDCKWNTKTPFASIRRIVQDRPEIFKVRPGLWALESQRKRLESEGVIANSAANNGSSEETFSHGYYQGLLIEIGRMLNKYTYVPPQDAHRMCLHEKLGNMTSIKSIPNFSYSQLTHKSQSVDVIWFQDCHPNDGILMPHTFFEVEHTTDIQNSLLKFQELRWFSARMLIVADEKRHREYETKLRYSAFNELRKNNRVSFMSYEDVVRQYNVLANNPNLSLII